MNNTLGIYSIFSLSGECLYIGQSRTIELRWRKHLHTLRKGTHPRKDFVEWFNVHGCGGEGIRFQILEMMPEDSGDDLMNEREIYWFNKMRPRFYGKHPSSREVWQHSEETRQKIRDGVISHNILKGHILNVKCAHCFETFTCVKSRIKKFCSRECANLSRNQVPYWDYQDILNLHETISLRKIAAMYGVSHMAIQKVLNNPPQ